MDDVCSPWKRPGAKAVSRGYVRHRPVCSPERKQEMLDAQGGLCAICQGELTATGYMAAQVDHDHATGELRGLLCRDCNTQLGRYEASAEQRARFERYLCGK